MTNFEKVKEELRIEYVGHIFKFVLWEDDAPYEIAELLKE